MSFKFKIWKVGSETFATYIDILARPYIIHLSGPSPRIAYGIELNRHRIGILNEEKLIQAAIMIYNKYIHSIPMFTVADLHDMVLIAKDKEVKFSEIYECDFDSRRNPPFMYTGNI